MTTKDRLHRLVDVLPEAELETAARVLMALILATRVAPAVRVALAAELDALPTGAW